MKKLTFILMMALCLTFTACNDTGNRNNEIKSISYRIYKVKVDNHDYIVARTNTIAGYRGGISIIHSESCECKKNK